jgi:hypothetical protein
MMAYPCANELLEAMKHEKFLTSWATINYKNFISWRSKRGFKFREN